jgi:hypothetical protein
VAMAVLAVIGLIGLGATVPLKSIKPGTAMAADRAGAR